MEDIIATKFYSPKKLVKMGILPWASAMTFKKRLQEPEWKALFNPVIEVRGSRKMIHIKGENIIKFQQLAANGELNIGYEKKQKNGGQEKGDSCAIQ